VGEVCLTTLKSVQKSANVVGRETIGQHPFSAKARLDAQKSATTLRFFVMVRYGSFAERCRESNELTLFVALRLSV